MATDWTAEQQNIYNDLLDEGFLFTFKREVLSNYDARKGEYETSTPESYQAPGIVKKVSSSNTTYEIHWGEGVTIEFGDKILLLAAGTYSPEFEDIVTLNDVDWRVKAFTYLEPALIPLLIYVLIRKA